MPRDDYLSVGAAMAPIDHIGIKLCDDTIERLFDDAFDGYCPVCRDQAIDKGELVCCLCLAKALAWHKENCTWKGCVTCISE